MVGSLDFHTYLLPLAYCAFYLQLYFLLRMDMSPTTLLRGLVGRTTTTYGGLTAGGTPRTGTGGRIITPFPLIPSRIARLSTPRQSTLPIAGISTAAYGCARYRVIWLPRLPTPTGPTHYQFRPMRPPTAWIGPQTLPLVSRCTGRGVAPLPTMAVPAKPVERTFGSHGSHAGYSPFC